jgi:hypothetical protein
MGAASAAVYAEVQRSLRRAMARQQKLTDRQIAALAKKVKALEAQLAVLRRPETELAEEMHGMGEIPALGDAAGCVLDDPQPAIKPEMLAAITAAASAFLGKAVHIRSVKPVMGQDAIQEESVKESQGGSVNLGQPLVELK